MEFLTEEIPVSITNKCLIPQEVGGTVSYGSAAALNLQCNPALFDLTLPGSESVQGPLNSSGSVVPGYLVPSK